MIRRFKSVVLLVVMLFLSLDAKWLDQDISFKSIGGVSYVFLHVKVRGSGDLRWLWGEPARVDIRVLKGRIEEVAFKETKFKLEFNQSLLIAGKRVKSLDVDDYDLRDGVLSVKPIEEGSDNSWTRYELMVPKDFSMVVKVLKGDVMSLRGSAECFLVEKTGMYSISPKLYLFMKKGNMTPRFEFVVKNDSDLLLKGKFYYVEGANERFNIPFTRAKSLSMSKSAKSIAQSFENAYVSEYYLGDLNLKPHSVKFINYPLDGFEITNRYMSFYLNVDGVATSLNPTETFEFKSRVRVPKADCYVVDFTSPSGIPNYKSVFMNSSGKIGTISVDNVKGVEIKLYSAENRYYEKIKKMDIKFSASYLENLEVNAGKRVIDFKVSVSHPKGWNVTSVKVNGEEVKYKLSRGDYRDTVEFKVMLLSGAKKEITVPVEFKVSK